MPRDQEVHAGTSGAEGDPSELRQAMGVRKFRSVEDMPGPAPLPRLDPENLRIAFGLSSLASGLRPVRRTPGVRKFGPWNELLAAKEESRIAARRP
jgi:hypothetical protein